MEIYLKYSGWLIIFVAYSFLVVPAIKLKRNKKAETISEAAVLSGGQIINIGAITAGIAQILFALYLINFVKSSLAIMGGIVFLLGSLSFGLVGFITVKKLKGLHILLIKFYFVLMAVGTFLLGTSFLKINKFGAVLCMTSIVIMALGASSFYIKKKYFEAEVWTIIFSTLWAVIIYVFII